MSVTAEQLRKSEACKRVFDEIVRDQLQIIDNKILNANRAWGWNVAELELPTMFQIPGLSKAEAQRIVYCAILLSLEKRGFMTRILLEENKTIVYIAWSSAMADVEVDAINNYIRSRRIHREDIQSFYSVSHDPTSQNNDNMSPNSNDQTNDQTNDHMVLNSSKNFESSADLISENALLGSNIRGSLASPGDPLSFLR